MTFWGVPNYGTFAQAYALQKAIQKLNPNRDVRQISHLDKRHHDFYFDYKSYLRGYPVWKKNFWRSFKPEYRQSSHARENKFLSAYDKIPHTLKIDQKNIRRASFEKIFIGSDIVWDYTMEPFNRDQMLFGLGFNAREINSYAASFGTVKLAEDFPEYVIEGIKKMEHISVRDKKSADIVEKITGKRPATVLDPAWIWDFTNDANLITPDEKDYILVYGQDFTEEFIQNLIMYAKDKGLKTIVLDCNEDNYTWCDKIIKQDELDPMAWIGYFKEASAVATSTFHGLTFGLIFNKRIAFCKTDFILAKTDVFLKQIGIYDVFEDKNNVCKMLDYCWDYAGINAYVDKERKKSLDFLRQACI